MYYKMRKGLSLKPSLAFLPFFVKQHLTQLKNLDNMIYGFKSDKRCLRREEIAGKNRAKIYVIKGTVVR
ncbi:MAG: hypothetical protein JWR72_1023 [Flavisolibacter sp.]|jgi:hypothetical protein|nr:hypothetical protein [Flavisolibacter sp.]